MKSSSNDDIETRDSNRRKLRRNRQLTAEEDDRTGGIQPPMTTTNHTSSDKIVDSGSAKIGAKRKNVYMTGELKFLAGTREPVVGTRAVKRMKKDHTFMQGASPEVGIKRKKDERIKGSGESVIELEKMELCKGNYSELFMELEKKKVELEKKKVENEKNIVEIEKKKVEIAKKKVEIEMKKVEFEKNKVERIIFQDKLAREEESRKRTAEDENATEKNIVEIEKKKMENEINIVEIEKKKVEIEKKKVEIEKKKVERIIFQDKLAREEESRKRTAEDENATEFWSNKCSDLESLVQRMKNENSTVRCVEPHIPDLVTKGDETSNQPATNDNCYSETITQGAFPKVSANDERTKGSGEPVIELESVESLELEKIKVEFEKMNVELEKNKVELEKKKVECTEFQCKLAEVEETRKSTAEDENATEFWRNKCSELESRVQTMENENSTVRHVESRVSNLGTLDPRNGKESSILRCQGLSYSEKIESEITQTGEKQGDKNNMSKPTTISHTFVGGASATFGTKMKNVERTGELKSLPKTRASKQRKKVKESNQFVDETSSEPDTSDSCDSETVVGGASATFGTKRKYVVRLRTGELKSWTKTTASKRRKMVKDGDQFIDETSNESATSNSFDSDGIVEGGSSKIGTKMENFERKKGSEDWACLEERTSQHGSPSHAHPGMSKKNFVNLVSDSDDAGDGLSEPEGSDCFIDSKNSPGDLMDMSALKNLNMNNDEMKWKSLADMLSSFEEDTVLCMKAVCALYRQVISKNEISPKGLVFDEDTRRCITLAKFLMDGDCEGDLKKSVKDLETLDSKAVGDCKKLAIDYSIYLFHIYENEKDPFFHPATTANNGDQTSKR